ncbi:hypothetical protein CP49_35735 [Bradyrhizobium valentinum]|uniref:Uncharacterized protein n=1 Tax=Bradyrhizobium valentinum TaxID=1518501 RepID=A0A0R3L4A2_9BRAD|nr:hypothetical protein CP49_35735 [Bradyrhizobium valentinum]
MADRSAVPAVYFSICVSSFTDESGMTFLRIVIPLYLFFDLSMISARTRCAFVARENRYPLFRIML